MLSQLRALATSTLPAYPGPATPFSPTAGAGDTKDAAAFATSQLGLIQDLVGDVKTSHAALQQEVARSDGGTAGQVGGGGPEETERKQYIEKMTHRHLELSRKLRLNARGHVVGGDFDPDSLRKGSEEVQKLEEAADRLARHR